MVNRQRRPKKITKWQNRNGPFVLASILVAELVIILLLFKHSALINGWRVSNSSNTSAQVTVDEPLFPVTTSTTGNKSVIPNTTHHYKLPTSTNGLAPVLSTIPTTEPVVFLGIDDGVNKQSFELQMMADNNIKASLFLANKFIKDNPYFFTDFINEGSLIEDHTLDHKLLPSLTYDEQKQEICGEADLFQQLYGRHPVLFRPPGGSYNQDTRRAAAACGMKAVILWIAKANGGSMQYQVGYKLRPGDIVLMHFRPEFKQDMQAFINAEQSAGLHTELLEDWLQ